MSTLPDTIVLTTISPATADAAVRCIAAHATSRDDLLHLLDVVRPAPFGGDVPDAPHSARPRYGL